MVLIGYTYYGTRSHTQTNKMKQRCPKCGSTEIEVYDDLAFIKCKKCGYDELDRDPLPYSEKKNVLKGKFNPYKTGGPKGKR